MKLSYLIAIGAALAGLSLSAPAAAQHRGPENGHPSAHRSAPRHAAPHRPVSHHVVHRPAPPRHVVHRPVHNWQWRHRNQHRVCRPVWRNHHRQQACFWVRNHR